MLNKIMVIGHLGAPPEMRFSPNGNPVTTFRIATSRYYKDQAGERKSETEWFTVVTWNRLAESCNQYLDKGKRAYVEGRLRTRQWENQEGQKRTQVEIVAERVLFLDKRESVGPTGNGKPNTAPAAANGDKVIEEDEMSPEDLPF
jgi:single-strand DNA-binding protein